MLQEKLLLLVNSLGHDRRRHAVDRRDRNRGILDDRLVGEDYRVHRRAVLAPVLPASVQGEPPVFAYLRDDLPVHLAGGSIFPGLNSAPSDLRRHEMR
uniref:B229_C3_225 n=1 Tax=Mycobacterium leprae TaxID=1769 RepID=Q49866_MYCLR|nr:B229_C3_225 [Mycobacterium leprae]